MLQSIKRALRIDSENGELHLNIVNFVVKGVQDMTSIFVLL